MSTIKMNTHEDQLIEKERKNLKRARNILIAMAIITISIFITTGVLLIPMGLIALICVIYLSWPSVKRRLFGKKQAR